MNEVLVILVWDKGEEIYSKPTLVNKKTKVFKFKGKKPNKAIVPESCVDQMLLRNIKKICAYNAKIIKAKGK